MEWSRDLSAELPTDFPQLCEVSGLAVADGAPVIAEALTVARLLGWLTGIWSDTEQVKGRGRHLRDRHGEPEALPPTWLAAVRAASSTRLRL